ncbi:caspase-7-like isoform X1 [Antennarius striatus]|uniref:caspase-7-like isoform X1 n=1 Tax=Antennarius striatus TaxID=241820 RepID=UPI0035B3B96E
MAEQCDDHEVQDGGDTADALKIFTRKKDEDTNTADDMDTSGSRKAEFDPYRYKMDYPSIGTCVIINNKNFHRSTEMSPRSGTDVDAARAMRTFSSLGYKIRFANDQTVAQMNQLLSSVSQEDHRDSASLACVLLSHGDEGLVYGTDGPEKFENLTRFFKGDRCMSLLGKPKLFFIQLLLSQRRDPFTPSVVPGDVLSGHPLSVVHCGHTVKRVDLPPLNCVCWARIWSSVTPVGVLPHRGVPRYGAGRWRQHPDRQREPTDLREDSGGGRLPLCLFHRSRLLLMEKHGQRFLVHAVRV